MEPTKGESIDAYSRGGWSRSSEEVAVMAMERRGEVNPQRGDVNWHIARRNVSFLCRSGAERPRKDGWQEPDESRGSRPVL